MTGLNGATADSDRADDAPLYALVHFTAEKGRSVAQVVGPFPDEHDAERFAAAHGLGDYTVGPLRFPALLAAPGGPGR